MLRHKSTTRIDFELATSDVYDYCYCLYVLVPLVYELRDAGVADVRVQVGKDERGKKRIGHVVHEGFGVERGVEGLRRVVGWFAKVCFFFCFFGGGGRMGGWVLWLRR